MKASGVTFYETNINNIKELFKYSTTQLKRYEHGFRQEYLRPFIKKYLQA